MALGQSTAQISLLIVGDEGSGMLRGSSLQSVDRGPLLRAVRHCEVSKESLLEKDQIRYLRIDIGLDLDPWEETEWCDGPDSRLRLPGLSPAIFCAMSATLHTHVTERHVIPPLGRLQ